VNQSRARLLEGYCQLPDQLESAVSGLSDAALDLTLGEGWSIREYAHHTVESEYMWQLFLRAVLGKDGIEIPIQWYFSLSQEQWARGWAFTGRAIGPGLVLLRSNTRSLVELLRHVPASFWKNTGRVTWPGAQEEQSLNVGDILRMQIRHVRQHSADISAIRELHHI
jgi:hypothetical protein